MGPEKETSEPIEQETIPREERQKDAERLRHLSGDMLARIFEAMYADSNRLSDDQKAEIVGNYVTASNEFQAICRKYGIPIPEADEDGFIDLDPDDVADIISSPETA